MPLRGGVIDMSLRGVWFDAPVRGGVIDMSLRGGVV